MRRSRVRKGFPGGSVVKHLPAMQGDTGLIPGLARSPGERNGNTLQYSCLNNLKDRGPWRGVVHRVTESDMTEQMSMSMVRVRKYYGLNAYIGRVGGSFPQAYHEVLLPM